MTAPSRPFDERGVEEAASPVPGVRERRPTTATATGSPGLFVTEGELVVPDYPDDLRPVIARTGREALRQVPDRLRIYARTFHQVTDQRYVVDGGTATGEVLCVAHHASAAGGPDGGPGDDRGRGTDTVWFIRYHDTYRHTDSGWRFARRELHLQWVEEHAIAPPGILPPADTPAG